ncbi:P-loop containing nucleoside triphosphate hydrolase protein [Fusarium acuminatum]|uniref:RNA helicase n=1 Tax=Fusarium acuminatum TaxID=5515 RepID=A0ABZ2WXA4_9HYPO
MVKKGKGKAGGGIDLSDPMPSAPSKNPVKGKKGQKGGTATPEAAPSSEPPKPTVKQLIGGSSWTGKLPVNLLSEYCQKQRWERPDYDTRKTPEGFSVWVTMSAKDPKTQETTRLEPFKIPATHKHLITRPTAIEAKHAAATYALFRVCSMQNKHTVLPPEHKSLWKDFQALKVQDLKEGKAWMYEPDPFKALQERQEAKAAADKKRKEIEAARAKAAAMPGASGLALMSNSGKDGRSSNIMKGWNTAPKVEMGKKTRAQLETLLRRGVKWNPNGIQMSKPQKDSIVAEFSKLSFRRSHVEEAVEYCKDREETLEWLLIHVPEDDLPRWALPESYAAGVSVGTTNLRRQGIIKRLAQAGYSLELATRVLDEQDIDEDKAAETLQNLLFPSEHSTSDEGDFLDLGSPEEQWEEEVGSLEAMYGDGFERDGDKVIRIKLDSVKNGQQLVDASLQIRRPGTYPANLILSIVANIPSYIKLSIVRKALEHIEESLRDEPMKIYLAMDWIQQNINGIIEDPGKLVDISAVSSGAAEYKPVAAITQKKRPTRAPKLIKWIKDEKTREQWLRRQESTSLKSMIAKRQNLPAWRMREAIIGTVRSNHVTIISGETGSGKSTQSMQFILDDLYSQGLGGCANIIVTQPRRISALGLADRVAEERCSRVGEEVGYAIRGESKRSKDTKITFVTTGVLLRRLQTSGGRVEDVVASLADVSHVVIDEVHERSLDTDFLLNLIREVMKSKKDMMKLILMSATLDAATFKNYFASEGLSVGTVEIEGRTFPVDEYYLDDVIRMTAYGVESAESEFISGEALETSITIDDIIAVIDSGKVKETSFDVQNNMRKLEETWASRAACKQRRGRAGRVQEGRCYKLFTQNLEQQMPERPEPEIRRVPLEQLCLSVRAMGMKDVAGFLGRSPTPPDATAIDGAMKLLQRMGALDGDELTAMGQQLAMLPADLRCGKLMVFGAIFGCLDNCVTIAAILSTRSPFVSPQERREEAKEARMGFYTGDGDLLTDLQAFLEWDFMMHDRIPHRQVRTWCDENFLNFQSLSDISNTRAQYYTALGEIGIVAPSQASSEAHAAKAGSDGSQLLRALVAAAFTPQIARIQYPDKKFASSMSGAVELDPEAKLIKFFNQENGRVFVHPSSTLFGSQGFSGNAAYMAYFSLISTSKIFIRDLTPFNAYTLLLFSGPIELDTLGRGLLVDGWLRLRGWARIGVLLARLRSMVDELIAKKVENPEMSVQDDEVITLVRKMIELDGLDA